MSAKHPAAFINAIYEEGTKMDAVKFLSQTWDELCDAKAEIRKLKAFIIEQGLKVPE